MPILIVCISKEHGNTQKVAEAMASELNATVLGPDQVGQQLRLMPVAAAQPGQGWTDVKDGFDSVDNQQVVEAVIEEVEHTCE